MLPSESIHMTGTDARPQTQWPDTSPPPRQRSADPFRSDGGAARGRPLSLRAECASHIDSREFCLDFWEYAAYPRICRQFEVVEARWP